VGAIGLYMLIRWLVKSVEQSQPAPQPEVPIKAPIITPPSRRPPPPLTVPLAHVVQWTEPRELVAWRAWRLGFFLRRAGGDGGPRLLSLSAPCIWNGPVVRDGVPLPTIEQPSGIYALKPEVADRIQWQNEHCWVTGTIALSGRVIEHELGYRAERAVVRDLRLGVGAHLALRSLKQLREIIEALETRYQVSVSVGQSEREIADRMIHGGHRLQCPKLPFVWDQHPWRLI
jgi:hypothetical protein